MSNEAISMCKHLTTATVRGDVNGQYHWANLIMLDALANRAWGPEVYQPNYLRLTDEQTSALFAQMNTERKNWTPDQEAQAQRIADTANAWAARFEAKESNPSAMTPDELNECRLDAEDAIEEARR